MEEEPQGGSGGALSSVGFNEHVGSSGAGLMPGPGRLREPTPCSDEDGSGQRRGRHASKSLVCVVDGCGEDLTNARKYFQRYRVCERHLKAPQLSMDGRSVRFCDQCSKFHDLSMFEGNRRTCNEKLERTRQARSDKRKQQWQVQQRYNHRSRPDPLSVELLDRELPMKRPFVVDMAGAGEPVDTVGAGLLDPYLGGGLAVGAGLLPPAKLGRLMPGALPPALGGPLAGVPGSPLGPITDLGGIAGDPLIGPPPRDTLEDARALLALRAGPSAGGVSPLPLGLPSPNFGRTSHPHGLSTDNASSLSSYDAHTEVPLRMDSVSSPGALASATAAAVAAAGGVDALLPSRAAAAAAARRAIALGLGPSGVPQGRGLADAAGLGEAQAAAADLLASGRGSRTGMGLAEGIGVGAGMGLGGGLAGGPTAAELLAAGQPDLLAAALDAQGALGRNGALAAVLRAAGNGGSGAIGATSRLVTAAAAAAREQLLLRQAMAAEDAGPGGLAPLRLVGDGGRGGGGLRIHPSVGVDEDGPLVVQRPSATDMRDLRDGLGGRDAMPLPLRSRSEPDRPGGSSAAATLAALGRLEAAAAAELLASRMGDPRGGGGGGRPSNDGGLAVPGRGGGGMSADDLSSAVAVMRRIESRSGSGSGSASAAMTVLASPGIDGDGPWQDASGPPQRQASGDRSQPPSAPSNRPSPRPSPTVPRPLAPPPVPSIKEEQVPMGRAGDTSGDPLISAAARRTSRDGGMADRMDGGAGAAAAAGMSQRERDLLSDLASLASSLRANRSPRATGNGLTVDVRGGGGLAAPGGRYGSPRDPPLEDAPPPRYAASPRDGPSPRVSDVGMSGGPLMRALAAAASARDGGGGSGGIGSGLLAALAAGGLKQEPGLGGGGGGGGVSFRDHDRPASASGGGYDGAGAAAAAVGGGAATADEIRMLRMLQERLAASGLALVRR